MRLFRAHTGFNRWIVSITLMAGMLSFIEHTCHMDMARLFTQVCCCEDDEQPSHGHHGGAHHEGMASHMGHGMEHEASPDAGCTHETRHDEGDTVQTDTVQTDPCCLQTMQTNLEPTWVRIMERGQDAVYAVLAVEKSPVEQPPPILNSLYPTISVPPYTGPPGYILFGAFLS